MLWGSRGFPAWGRRALVLGPSLPALTFPMQQLTIELVGLSFLSRDMCPPPLLAGGSSSNLWGREEQSLRWEIPLPAWTAGCRDNMASHHKAFRMTLALECIAGQLSLLRGYVRADGDREDTDRSGHKNRCRDLWACLPCGWGATELGESFLHRGWN